MRLGHVQEQVEFSQMEKVCMFKTILEFLRLFQTKISIVRVFIIIRIAGKS